MTYILVVTQPISTQNWLWPLAGFVLGRPEFKPEATLVNQLTWTGCLLPVLFEIFLVYLSGAPVNSLEWAINKPLNLFIALSSCISADFCLVHLLLSRHPGMLYQHFVECVFHFNSFEKHKGEIATSVRLSKITIKSQFKGGAVWFILQSG